MESDERKIAEWKENENDLLLPIYLYNVCSFFSLCGQRRRTKEESFHYNAPRCPGHLNVELLIEVKELICWSFGRFGVDCR